MRTLLRTFHAVFLACVVVYFWTGVAAGAPVCSESATDPLLPDELPYFVDDLSLELLGPAVDRSVRYLARLPAERMYSLCGKRYSVGWLQESLRAFGRLVAEKPTPEVLTQIIKEQFIVCRASGRNSDGKVFLTGYFEPFLPASLERTEVFRYPLYRTPPDLVSPPNGKGKVGRMENGALLPYWTRAEIEGGGLLAGHELLYLADPVDAFVLHVQGSGQVRLADNTVRRVQYAAKNGRDYRSIGRYLVEKGILPLEEVTMPRIVSYLQEHPEEQLEVLRHNDSFVFFRWGDDSAGGPQGCLGEPLTPGRSVALDQGCFPPGILGFVKGRKPRVDEGGTIVGWEPLQRFVLNQDTGSAISGPGRLDLFWGAGQYAEVAAGNMKHPGTLYFLVKKKK